MPETPLSAMSGDTEEMNALISSSVLFSERKTGTLNSVPRAYIALSLKAIRPAMTVSHIREDLKALRHVVPIDPVAPRTRRRFIC